jgi:hypothetical protein
MATSPLSFNIFIHALQLSSSNVVFDCNRIISSTLFLSSCLILAIGIGSIGMVTTQAKAFERTCHYWSNGDSQCEWGPYFAYTQQPTIHTVSCEPCGNAPGPGWACNTC